MDLDDRASGRVKLRDLRLLVAVSQWGSMAEAAKRLNVSQPAITKAVANLEYALGVRLFDRSARGVEPTTYGKVLLKRGMSIFDELQGGVREIAFLADPSAGDLHIGSAPPFVEMLSLVIERLSMRHPNMVFRVAVGDSGELECGDLRERKIELVFGRIGVSAGNEMLQTEILFEDYLVVVADANNRWARKRKVKLADLIDERWHLPPGPAGSHVAEAFRSYALPLPRLAVTSNSTHLRDLLLATGRYLSVAPASEVQMSTRRLSFRILPIDLGVARRPIGIVTLKNRTLSPPAQLFIDEARILASRMGKS
jgi:DNA-binding transcriptional LysR family regulator